MLKKLYFVILLSGFIFCFLIHPFFVSAEPFLYEIYNTIYGDTYVDSNEELETNYGVAYDETFIETNAVVRAKARFAGYTQSLWYYPDVCIGTDLTGHRLLDVTTTGYLDPGEYYKEFTVGDSEAFGFASHPYGTAPPDTWWFSQPLLNEEGNKDHMWMFRAPDFDPENPEYFIAWEDQNLGDEDYNDLVLIIENVAPYPLECCEKDDDCPNDGVFCNGEEICEDNVCTHSGNPCAPETECNHCNEGAGNCYDPSGTECTSDDNPCTDDECDGAGNCVHIPNNDPCDDGLSCTHPDTCDMGVCVGTPNNADCDDENVCTDDICDPNATPPGTGCVYVNNNEPCEDGVYCNGDDTCSEGECKIHTFDRCVDGNKCTQDICIESPPSCEHPCIEGITYGDPCCEDPACADLIECKGALISTGDVWYNPTVPGSDRILNVGVKVPICLKNLYDEVGGVSLDLCEKITGRGKVDCLECVGCEMTERTQMFSCMVNELQASDPNPDCCALVVFATHPGGVINPGECDIVTIDYKFKDTRSYCVGEEGCIEIYIAPDSLVVVDQYDCEIPSAVNKVGSVCPWECGDVYPPDNPATPEWDCGDGEVDIMDIVEEVNFILKVKTPDDCQGAPPTYGPRDDVSTGTPPPVGEKCIAPDGKIDILDLMVIIDMVLDRPNCCDYVYGGVVY